MPPTAAAIGSAARRGSRRSPATNSRLSSSPTTKKKMASSPSAAHAEMLSCRCSASGPISNSDIARYVCDHGEFAHTSAAPAATSSSTPPTVSLRRISENRCDSDHEPRVRSRIGAGIGLILEKPTRMPLMACDDRRQWRRFPLVRREVWSAVSSPTPERLPCPLSSAVHARTASDFAIRIEGLTKRFGTCGRRRRPEPDRSAGRGVRIPRPERGRASPPPFVCCSG